MGEKVGSDSVTDCDQLKMAKYEEAGVIAWQMMLKDHAKTIAEIIQKCPTAEKCGVPYLICEIYRFIQEEPLPWWQRCGD